MAILNCFSDVIVLLLSGSEFHIFAAWYRIHSSPYFVVLWVKAVCHFPGEVKKIRKKVAEQKVYSLGWEHFKHSLGDDVFKKTSCHVMSCLG